MKQIHLLCNAHLDPVWQWQRPEGMGEAISTFRIAADFCEQNKGFVFNHNESLLYEWVEEYDPALFKRIQDLVKQGKWHIMGGWYLQPDCTMLSGESFLRQIEIGNRYFIEKFGVKPITAMNVDPFGHTRGLVQILAKTGYENYLFMRPNGIVPERDFIWEGYDGSRVLGHCLWAAYRTPKGQAGPRVAGSLALEGDSNLVLWGIGNHGGGPSKDDLDNINAIIAAHPEIQITHSDCNTYFATVDKDKLQVIDRSMVHCMVGCYTAMVRIKQMHRTLENKLNLCEKLLAVSGIDYDKKEWEQAQKALMFNQFHDILPGSMVKAAEEDSLRLFHYGDEIVSRLITKAMFKLSEHQTPAAENTIPVMVFNPHPYAVETDIPVEFMLQEQNRNENEVTIATAYDINDNRLPTQNIKEGSNITMDWRKACTFHAVLEPMQLNRFDLHLEVVPLPRRPIAPCEETKTHFVVSTNDLTVKINKQSGLIDQYTVNGKDYLKANSGKIRVYAADEDPWGMVIGGYHQCLGEMTLVSNDEANRINGCPNATTPNVRVIENGDVVCRIQATFGFENSYAIATYTIPKQGEQVDLHLKTVTADANRVYKLCFDTNFDQPAFVGQTAFGREVLLNGEREVTYQKWCGMEQKESGLYLLNRGTYGGSCVDNRLQVTLLHTAAYCAHPIPERQLVDTDLHLDRMDMGQREYDFALTTKSDCIDAVSEQFNQPPQTLVYFPSGDGNTPDTAFSFDNKQVVLSCYKPTNDGASLIRLFNPLNENTDVTVTVGKATYSLHLTPYEAATYRLDKNKLTPCDMIQL
ncbi:MAG: alpha-mannosidase [Clostridia bacterium]|nr:alpha-mannosidase [Clostridia bacterium]